MFMVEILSSEAQGAVHRHVMSGGREEVIVFGWGPGGGLAYEVQPRAQKVPRTQHMNRRQVALCLSLQNNGSTCQVSDSQREAVDRGLGPLVCLT